MKKIVLLWIILICVGGQVHAQAPKESFIQEQRKAAKEYMNAQRNDYKAFSRSTQNEFKEFCDSLNMAFASYLSQTWEQVEIKAPVPAPIKPVRHSLYNPVQPVPELAEMPVKINPVTTPIPLPTNISIKKVDAVFFGTSIAFKAHKNLTLRLKSSSEKDVADCWRALTQLPYADFVGDLISIAAGMHLNDWGMYQLLNKMSEVYFPYNSSEEKTIFTVFILNQLGYRAKVGRMHGLLLPLIAFKTAVYNTSAIVSDNETYYIISPHGTKITSLHTYVVDYDNAGHNIDLATATLPHMGMNRKFANITVDNKTYIIQYNQNLIDLYDTYPCTEFEVYAENPIDDITLQSLDAIIVPMVKGKNKLAAVNDLLHFVQYGFSYQEDDKQFGREKFFFAEELFAYPYSDCEDRAVFFSKLVRRYLNMKIVLIHYKDYHLATAVKFDDNNARGSYVTIDAQSYFICDPTYIGAKVGMAMEQFENMKMYIIKLK